MEKLILKCGRFIPTAEGDAMTRILAMETYLSRLTDELEYLLSELDRTLGETSAAQATAAREEG
ncbi:MAG: hypothetical protein IJX72_02495 [Clostridia bacterium]|nr:hypothetical protein [Clostridia bacterium]